MILRCVGVDAPPIYIINTANDSMPYHQIVYMQCALQNAGVTNFQVSTIPNSSDHAFHYWSKSISPPAVSPLVKDEVIEFLDSHVTKLP